MENIVYGGVMVALALIAMLAFGLLSVRRRAHSAGNRVEFFHRHRAKLFGYHRQANL